MERKLSDNLFKFDIKNLIEPIAKRKTELKKPEKDHLTDESLIRKNLSLETPVNTYKKQKSMKMETAGLSDKPKMQLISEYSVNTAE